MKIVMIIQFALNVLVWQLSLSSRRVSVSLVLSLWLLRCELIDMSVSASEDITGIY